MKTLAALSSTVLFMLFIAELNNLYEDGLWYKAGQRLCAPMLEVDHFTYNDHKYTTCADINNTFKTVEIK
jgi:hypothetical protein